MSVADHLDRSLQDPAFRDEHERLAPFEELARLVIMRRAALGLTQAELARRVKLSASTVSRIERGQHGVSISTSTKVGEALRE